MGHEQRVASVLLNAKRGDCEAVVDAMPETDVREFFATFGEWAHRGQLAPEGDHWRTWVMMAGRGFGKTRAGAEWVMGLVRPAAPSSQRGKRKKGSRWPAADFVSTSSGRAESEWDDPHPSAASRLPPSPDGRGNIRIALVAASLDEARRVLVEGPSGILAVAREGEVVEYSFQRRRIVFASGAEATLFSGSHPDGLRGPEHDYAWCDELAKWRHPQETWDNLQLGLRRGARPRALVTTTPRRVEALRRLLGEPDVEVTRGASGANPHLPAGWVEAQRRRLTGLLARQELGGELLEEVSGALWTRAGIEGMRGWPEVLPEVEEAEALPYLKGGPLAGPGSPPRLRGGAGGGSWPQGKEEEVPPLAPPARAGGELFVRIVVGVDPPATALGDECGILVCGMGVDGVAYVLADASAGGLSPEGWARKVAAAAEAWGASLIVAEANNGGEMIKSVLRAAGATLPVKLVHARRAKGERAAVAAALFEGGKAKFAGCFPALEEELTGLSYDQPYAGPGRSPDRADAMVWALDALCPGGAGPSVRGL